MLRKNINLNFCLQEEIQNKFQSQFQSLELEVKRRDEIISQLQKRIHELEVGISFRSNNWKKMLFSHAINIFVIWTG
jgi:hypothetical protein